MNIKVTAFEITVAVTVTPVIEKGGMQFKHQADERILVRIPVGVNPIVAANTCAAPIPSLLQDLMMEAVQKLEVAAMQQTEETDEQPEQ